MNSHVIWIHILCEFTYSLLSYANSIHKWIHFIWNHTWHEFIFYVSSLTHYCRFMWIQFIHEFIYFVDLLSTQSSAQPTIKVGDWIQYYYYTPNVTVGLVGEIWSEMVSEIYPGKDLNHMIDIHLIVGGKDWITYGRPIWVVEGGVWVSLDKCNCILGVDNNTTMKSAR